jgi:predicted kinase
MRKQLISIFQRGSDNKVHWSAGIYARQMKHNIYDALLNYAQKKLVSGKTVVLDAPYVAREERAHLIQLAEKVKIIPHFILCYCSEETTRERFRQRADENELIFDADWKIFKKQRGNIDSIDSFEEKMVVSINTENPIEDLLEQLDYAIEKRPSIFTA